MVLYERLPPRGSWRRRRLKEYACIMNLSYFMPRKTPSVNRIASLLLARVATSLKREAKLNPFTGSK